MNTQKIQARGFTLVELIVVITILVILGTIAFINLGGVSGSARDSQRISDLNQINTQITVTQAKNGIVYDTLVTPNTAVTNKVSNATIAGNTNAATLLAYTVGDLNYAALGIDSAKMKDPTAKVAYKIGQTTLAGGAYELSAAMEDYNGGKAGLVMGTYRARTIASTTSTGTVSGTAPALSVALTSTPSNFRVGDWIIAGSTAGVGTAQITAISSDTKTLTLSGTLTLAAAPVSLAQPDVAGLTASGGTSNTSAVINQGSVLPYTP